LTYSANLPSGASLNPSTGFFSWTPTSSQITTYGVTFQVSDGKLSDYEYIYITVTNTNRAPVLAPIGNKTAAAGQTLSFTISASDQDGNALTYSASPFLPGASLNSSTGSFSWTPTSSQITTYGVTFQVSDGKLSDYEYISIKVNAAVTNGQISEL
jgi:hypothetical protein